MPKGDEFIQESLLLIEQLEEEHRIMVNRTEEMFVLLKHE